MSGFRGTIGNPDNDKVIAWIYDKMEFLPIETRRSIFKLIQGMINDSLQVNKIEEISFRYRMALLVRNDFFDRINNRMPWLDEPMKARLRNLTVRYYRKAIEIGRNAPLCGWCQKHITVEQPFKLRNNEKMHYKCAAIYDKSSPSQS